MSNIRYNFFNSRKARIAFIALTIAASATLLTFGILGTQKSTEMYKNADSDTLPDKQIFEGLVQLAKLFNCTVSGYPKGNFYGTSFTCTGDNHYSNQRKLYGEADDYLDDVYASEKDKKADADALATISMFMMTCFPIFANPLLWIALYGLVGMTLNIMSRLHCPVRVGSYRLFEDQTSTTLAIEGGTSETSTATTSTTTADEESSETPATPPVNATEPGCCFGGPLR